MKKFLPLIVIALILIIIIVLINTINFGALAIGAIERTTKIEIRYREMQGNIFQGFRIKGYTVKLSTSDSLVGELCDVNYQFKPFMFSLPNLFQVTLIEPTAWIKQKKSDGKSADVFLPTINLGLRVNVKNGKLIYQGAEIYKIERISGLILLDFIKGRIFLSTMNLSLKTEKYPLNITSANLNLRIDQAGVEMTPSRIKGVGITFNGAGTYFSKNNQATLKLRDCELDLAATDIYRGKLKFSGDVEYTAGKLSPRIEGTAEKVYPFDHFKFETAASFDTIWINIIEGTALTGNLSARAKIVGLKDLALAANFFQVDIRELLNLKQPLLVSGYLNYQKQRFDGFISAPGQTGIGIDSLFVFGALKKSQIFLDSLYVREGTKSIEINGRLYADCDLSILLNNFNISKFARFLPITGTLMGAYRLQGNLKNPMDLIITSDLTGHDLSYGDFKVKNLVLRSEQFQISNLTNNLEITLENASFRNWRLREVNLTVQDNKFAVTGDNSADRVAISGTIARDWTGEIVALGIKYHGAETKNINPIGFDLAKRKFGDINISFIDGTLKGTLTPLDIELVNGNLEKLGMILGIKEKFTGLVQCRIAENRFSINAQTVNFMGIKNGSLVVAGDIKKNGLNLDTLALTDDNNQTLNAQGLFALDESDLKVKINHVGIWALPFLRRYFAEPKGFMSGEISYQGNLNNIKFAGEGEITDASFGINVVAMKFDSVKGHVKFDGNQILFESAEGFASAMRNPKLTGTSKVTGGGFVKIDPGFNVRNINFEFSFRDAPIQYQPYVFGLGSGNFSISAHGGKTYYNGNITVKEGIVPMNFWEKTKPVSMEEDTNWLMNIKVKGDRDVWLRNRQADIEFSGEIYIIKEHTPLYLSGNMETLRGNFYWLSHILSVTQGTVTFVPGEVIDPKLDVWAEMNTREGIKVILHVFGTLAEPIFEFFSDPPIYSEQDIMTYLNLNITWQEVESIRRGEYVGKILPQTILYWLQSDVSRRIREYTGLDYFRIEAPLFEAGETEEKTKLTVGKYVSKDLFITYTYGVTTFSNEFNVEYFINDKNEILIKKDETGEYNLQYQYRIRF